MRVSGLDVSRFAQKPKEYIFSGIEDVQKGAHTTQDWRPKTGGHRPKSLGGSRGQSAAYSRRQNHKSLRQIQSKMQLLQRETHYGWELTQDSSKPAMSDPFKAKGLIE